MAEKKDSQLTVATTLADADRIRILADPAGTPASKTITKEDLRKGLIASAVQGDIIYHNGTDLVRLAAGTSGQVLQTQGAAANPQWANSTAGKGIVEFISSHTPLTLGATIFGIDGGSTPAEQFPYFEFVDGSTTYVEFLCRLRNYNGGGLTFDFQVLRTSAGAGAQYSFEAAVRRLDNASEDITASHSYAYNAVTVTVPAGPPAAGIPMAGQITFTDGADMDSVANNEAFVLRLRRVGGSDSASDTARVLATISGIET